MLDPKSIISTISSFRVWDLITSLLKDFESQTPSNLIITYILYIYIYLSIYNL